jgi:prepilin-type N-terminal cleavage/methylation domain-containing protein
VLKKLRSKSAGFTLVEVVIVLAIAGLIMVIVFLAVNGAQRGRRDTQRKTDASRYLAAAEQFAANNNGAYPTAAQVPGIVGTYITNGGGTFNDPTTGGVYTVTGGVGAPGAAGAMSASPNAQCTGGVIAAGGGLRRFAVSVFQENGGQFCVSN